MKPTFYRRMALLVMLPALCAAGYAQKTPSSLLWRISGNGLSKPSFLYGTIHLNDKRLFYFGDSLYHYLEQAEGFHIEIDADSAINATVRKWTQYNNGRFLKSLMNQKEFEQVAGKLSKSLHKPADKITTRDVWMAKNRKSAEAYQKGDMQNFMDLYLYGIAKKQGKLVGGIEDVEDQMSIIDDLFDEMDLAYLTQDEPDKKEVSMVEKMKTLYLKQDLDEIQSYTAGITNQQFRDRVLMRRNLKMARRMDSLARQRSSFFAVGVAHLPGDTGVIDLLRKRGFAVEPVFSSKKIAPENYTYKTIYKPWITFTQDLNLYHVDVPGAMQPMDLMKEVMDMKFYYDVLSGKAYYTAVVNSIADDKLKDSVFASMINRMTAKAGDLVSQKTITSQNWEGRDVVMKAGAGQLIHLHVYMAGGYAYMAMLLSKTAELNDADAKRFFDSFSMTPAASIARPYTAYRDTLQAFSILFPQDPSVQEQTEQEKGDIKVLSATDYSTGNTYSVTVRNTKAGMYIDNDTSYLQQIRTKLLAIMKNDTVISMLPYQGYPAMQINGSAKVENVYYQTLSVLRGNRAYFVIAQSKLPKKASALTDSFLHSFILTDYSRGDWQIRTALDGSFTTWLPAPVETNEVDSTAIADMVGTTADAEKDTVENSFVFHDKATGTAYNVQRELFPAYYFRRSDSSFFSLATAAFKTEGDSITHFKLLTVLNNKAADVQLDNPAGSIVKKLRFILHGDTLYKLFTYTPRWLAGNMQTKEFFERFTIHSTAPATTLFTNKTAQLVADLASGDSAVFARASRYLYDETLQKEDITALYPLLLQPLRDFSESNYNTHNRLVISMAPLADSATVDFVLQHYAALKGENQKLQYGLLKLLVTMKQPYATASALRLFNAGIAPGGNPGLFAHALSINLPVAHLFFPTIIQQTKDTAAALEWAYLLTRLLDSNYISRQELLPYLGNFIAAADAEKKKAAADNYNYGLTSILELLGNCNNTAANTKLQEYSRINNLGISYQAVTWLLKNKQALWAPAINKLAQSEVYRTDIYDTLKKAGKSSLFPAAQRSQRLFAASYMRSYAQDDDEEPADVQYVSELTSMYKGKKQKFYLFKLSYGEGEDATHHLGIAGPFTIQSAQVTSDNDATGVHWKETYSFKKINAQFAAYLSVLEEEQEDP